MATEKDDQQPEKPAPVTREDVEKMAAEIANRAATEHGKRLTAKHEKAMEEARSREEALRAEVAELRGTKPAPAPTPDGDSEVSKLRKEFEARERERAKREADKDAEVLRERAARAAEEERNAAMEALAELEVPAERRKGAYLQLKEEGRIGREDGRLVFLVPKDGYTDKVPLGDGIKAWGETAEGKAYLPAKGLQGSGNKGGGLDRRSGGGKPSRAERVQAARQALASVFLPGGDSEG